ncbi:SDR family NAD(P)-dependent oxidoreductase [Uliginosibacterium sp. H3]|uniref:SDR family NAD(P)-dependent oxidoreductase n=1 Tax=Uliginosibacterium silvisoli TaxID=3114758 RepID=A0ABU6K1R4_9RHOO|nr:SDR family NAD(P)-dependent oxidoreductase [Uliginosibacterium sp. H3]
MKRIAIIGATSLIAEQSARLWVREAVALTLVGRELSRLERIAADLRVRSPQSSIVCKVTDFADARAIASFVDDLDAEGGAQDLVLIAHGTLPDQKACEQDLVVAREALAVNGLSPVLFAEAFARRMAEKGQGTIAVIGSVAGDRGRRSNYVYGAAKSLVDRYLEGMRHRFAGTGVRVITIKPGPTDTPMTAHLKGGVKLAAPEDVAAAIVSGVEAGKPVIYAPFKWRIIMAVIRALPTVIFNRLNI